MNWRIGLTTLGVVAVIGGVGYIVYKSYKVYQKEQEERERESKNLQVELSEETPEELKNLAKNVMETTAIELDQKIEEINSQLYDVVDSTDVSVEKFDYNNKSIETRKTEYSKTLTATDIEESLCEVDEFDDYLMMPSELMEPYNRYSGIMLERIGDELRHEKNSEEAFYQYRKMMLSEYENLPPAMLGNLGELFDIPYAPVSNAQDGTLMMKIKEERARFFGDDSIYVDKPSMAEMFMFMANLIEFDYSTPVDENLKMLFHQVDFEVGRTTKQLTDTCTKLMRHEFVNADGRFGLFGLTKDDFDEHLFKYPSVTINTNADISFVMEKNVWSTIYGDEWQTGF